MAQNYISLPANFLLLLSAAFVNDVVASCDKKGKKAGMNLMLAVMFLSALTANRKALAHTISNNVFKMQFPFNHYLAYASSHGIGGGGGGGGHGNVTA